MEKKRIEDIFQKTGDKELAPILSEYLIRNIGDNDYEWWSTTFDGYMDYSAGSKTISINYHKGAFLYGRGAAMARGKKLPGNEPIKICGGFPGEQSKYDSHSEIKKSFWNGEQAIYEQYIPEQGLIVARVCTAKTVTEYSKSCGYYNGWKKLTPKKLTTWDIPEMMHSVTVDETIIVTENNPGEFVAIVCDAYNNSTSFYIGGESLYDAYYNYMVARDYFTEVGQKTERKACNRG